MRRRLERAWRPEKSAFLAAGSHNEAPGRRPPLWWRVRSPPSPLYWDGGEILCRLVWHRQWRRFHIVSHVGGTIMPLATPRDEVSLSAIR